MTRVPPLEAVKQFVIKQVLDRLLTEQMTAPWLLFWARFVIRSRRPKIIGITGSVGKTTTTEMIAAVLEHPEALPIVGRVRHASKNMNDDVGLPLTVLGYDRWVTEYAPTRYLAVLSAPMRAIRFAWFAAEYPDWLVLEFGTHWKGHLHRLAKAAPPDIGVVTTIGPAHLERLGTLQGVVREKSAVVRAVPPAGLVVLGDSHEFVAQLAAEARSRVVKVPGRGVELARAIARVVCQELRLPEALVARALAGYRSPKGRLNLLEIGGVSVLDDSHNANPLSMKLALDTLAEMAGENRRRVAILGPMAELGEESQRYHDELADYAARRVDALVGVGDPAKRYRGSHWFESSDACAESVMDLIREGDCVLVKGAGSAQMARVVEALINAEPTHGAIQVSSRSVPAPPAGKGSPSSDRA